MPDPSFVRLEVIRMLPIWRQIRDCIEGEMAIKGEYFPGKMPHGTMNGYYTPANMVVEENRAKYYLPVPNAEDDSEENRARYRSYISRAQFYPVTSRTIDGLSGEVFQRAPELTIPDEMKVLLKDIDGNGLDLDSFAKKTVTNLLAYGRMGIFTDYPQVTGPTTRQQLADGDIRPVLIFYDPWDIINWSTTQRGALRVLSLVVLREIVFEVGDDEFSTLAVIQYRVLRLDAQGNYTIEIWRDQASVGTADADWQVSAGPFLVKDGAGKPMRNIPFEFAGAASNDWHIDKPPMADIASMNIGHYRNSADYEESCYIAGQPTPVFSGLEQSWVDKNFAGKTVMLGSRKAVLLGKDAKAELLQAAQNSTPMEAMKHKEEQMMAIGARLITQNKTTRTATETTVQQSSENSTLGNIAVNAGCAIMRALISAAKFMNIEITDPKEGEEPVLSYKLNSDFDIDSYSPEELMQMLGAYQAGGISWTEYRSNLRAAGLASQKDAVALKEIQEEKAAAFQLGGHPIADPFGLPPGVEPPAPIPPPGSPADVANKAAATAAATAAAAAKAKNNPAPKGGK